MKAFKVAALVLLGLTLSATLSMSATLRVPIDYPTIQGAINASSNGDFITVAAGTYNENIDFKGKRITVRGTLHSVFKSHQTIINGQMLGPCVKFISAENSNSKLENIRLENGYSENGGGIWIGFGGPSIDNVYITNCSAINGGGIYISLGDNTSIRNSNIVANSADLRGGGVYITASNNWTISDSIISNNTAPGAAGLRIQGNVGGTLSGNIISHNTTAGIGGGLSCGSGNITTIISNNTFTQNNARDGAGIAVSTITTDAPTIRENTITYNTATGSGGGIGLDTAKSTKIEQNIISNNSAVDNGGGIASQFCSAQFTRNSIIQNNAGQNGGGAVVSFGTDTFLKNVFAGNTAADSGGGVLIIGTNNPSFINNTIAKNQAVFGGGVYSANCSPIIRNCIVALNTGTGGISTNMSPTKVPQVSFTCVFGHAVNYRNFPNQSGTNGNISVDPRFANANAFDFHLRSCNGRFNDALGTWQKDSMTSRCIDAGNPADSFDVETIPRGGRINMGAYGNTEQASRSSMVQQVFPPHGSEQNNRLGAVIIDFLKPVLPLSAQNHFQMTDNSGQPVEGTFNWMIASRKMRFKPSAPLSPLTTYNIRLTPGIKCKDNSTYGYEQTFFFKTGNQPVVTAHSPSGEAVARSVSIVLTFDEPMNKASVQNNLVIDPPKAGTFTWSNAGRTVTFKPNAPFVANRLHKISLTRAARSTAGNQMDFAYSWSFRTSGLMNSTVAMSAAAAPTRDGNVQVTVSLSAAATVQVRVLNIAGRQVAVLPEQNLEAGINSLLWNGRSITGTTVPPGQYLVTVEAFCDSGERISQIIPLRR